MTLRFGMQFEILVLVGRVEEIMDKFEKPKNFYFAFRYEKTGEKIFWANPTILKYAKLAIYNF